MRECERFFWFFFGVFTTPCGLLWIASCACTVCDSMDLHPGSSCVHGTHSESARAYVYVYEYVSHVLDEDASSNKNRLVQPPEPNKATTCTVD